MTSTRSMTDLLKLKDELSELIENKLDEKLTKFESSLSLKLVQELKKEILDDIGSVLAAKDEKIEHLESTVMMLQQHVSVLKDQHRETDTRFDDLEQYGRRLCLRVNGLPTQSNESADDVLGKVRNLIEKVGVDIPDNTLDRAHRIGKKYKSDSKPDVEYQSVIVRFSTFRHRTKFYQARKSLPVEDKIRINLDLTKQRYAILSKAITLVKDNDKVEFVFADINCCLKVRLASGNALFFTTIDELENILNNN